MEVAWLALLIATISLLWNVVSTVYGWRRSRPHVQLHYDGPEDGYGPDGEHIVSLRVTAVNYGGSTVPITSVGVQSYSYDGERGGAGSYLEIDEEESDRSKRPYILRPALPYALATSHSVKWRVDAAYIVRDRPDETPPFNGNAFVDLSTRQRIWCTVIVDDWVTERARDVIQERVDAGKFAPLSPKPPYLSILVNPSPSTPGRLGALLPRRVRRAIRGVRRRIQGRT